MTCQTYNINDIAEILKRSPRRYHVYIKNNPSLLNWLKSQFCGRDINLEHIPEMVYALMNSHVSEYCGSGNRRQFRNVNVGWLGCCDKKCPSCKEEKLSKMQATSLARYGTKNPAQSQRVKDAMKATNIERYGVEYTLQSDEIRSGIKQKYIDAYGVDHFWKTEEGQAKRKQTMIDRYGVSNPSLSQELVSRRADTNDLLYGGHPMRNPEVYQRVVDTVVAKYGVTNISNIDGSRDKARQSTMNRFGVEHASQSDIVKEMMKETFIERYGVANPMQSVAVKERMLASKRNSFYDNLSERVGNLVTPLFGVDDYIGVEQSYKWKCVKCATEFYSNLDDGKSPVCPTCYPTSKSKGQDEVFDFIVSLIGIDKVEKNDRTILAPKELDILVSEYNFAIEFNGIYHHCEISGGKDRNYHLNKFKDAKAKGIHLIQVTDLEWANKQEIVKSRIRHKLKLNERIQARKCSVEKISATESRIFLDANHIQGSSNASIRYGLFHNDELVAVMTFGKSRYSNVASYELIRFCSKINISVVGGANKLLTAFERDHKNSSLISYCDLRYGNGEVYEKLGFTFSHQSNPNYHYYDGYKLQSRLAFQKHKLKEKLEKFDPNSSEWKNMQDNGYDRIWDCGNLVFIKK